MKLQNAFKKNNYITISYSPTEVPRGLVRKCKHCNSLVLAEDVKERGYICPKCDSYFRMHAKRRIEAVADVRSFKSWFTGLESVNPLEDESYPKRIAELKEKTALDEAVLTGSCTIGGIPVALGVMDCRFLMGSMGHVVGEKIALLMERATSERLPVVLFCCSGGARMQEGMVSLMQMAKTSAAIKKHSDAGLFYLPVLTDPTTGGVTASFAMLGDVILAEPNALIGFAGPRVIEQTIGQKLPKGFQRSEFLLEHGFIDAIVERNEMRDTIEQILRLHQPAELQEHSYHRALQQACGRDRSAWERVLLSRRNDRPAAEDYITNMFENFLEFHGDRTYGDDGAIVGGIATLDGIPVTVIGQAKGHNTKENLSRNFGMPSPEGYRKALRLMKQAEKFHRPVICFVDTPGAFCGLEAEERGQGEAIARNLYEMSTLATPVVSILIGEGGSGGALAMAVSDEVWILENAVYSILSPEGYASILWKDSKLAQKAAETMKMTAGELLSLGMVERVFVEPEGYTVESMSVVTRELREALLEFLSRQGKLGQEELLAKRYERFRKF